MYLKRLELVGFKSFAKKTVLEFPAGVAAVVGPNGSGKSNIIDAIRWLLGEREAKNMRGLKAEDLIFAGTAQRPRLGLAQASIVFDNQSKFFPVDFHEVAIRRRVERDGTSKYFLNDSEVRVKDVIDFFAQSRLGTKGFSIINQGDSDLFVRASPKERRAMLEEILGLRQYQLKKHDAELKLKTTKFNMEKAQALIDEIMPHLRMLRRQTSKWSKYGDLEKELLELEKNYFGSILNELAAAQSNLEPLMRELEAEIKKEEKELEKLEEKLKVVESKETAVTEDNSNRATREEREKILKRRAELERELGRAEAQLEILLDQPAAEFNAPELVKLLEEVRETIEDILYEANIKAIKDLLKPLFEKINHILDAESAIQPAHKIRHAELEENRSRLVKELGTIDEKLKTLAREEQELGVGLKKFTEVFRKAFEDVAAKKDQLSAQEKRKSQLLFDLERLNIKRGELDHQAAQSGRRLADFSPLAVKNFDSATAERQILKLRAELASIGEVDQAVIKEAEETEARYEFLASQIADLEKAHKDLTDLLKDLDIKIHDGFTTALKSINEEFQKYFRMMFGGGQGRLKIKNQRLEIKNNEENGENSNPGTPEEPSEEESGIDIEVSIPRKKIHSLEMLSGGEKSLVSLAVLFSLISVSPPPFLVFDEVDAALDEINSRRFSLLVRDFSKKTQFLLVTHNRATMEAADVLYGVTMGEDGTSKVLSLKLEPITADQLVGH